MSRTDYTTRHRDTTDAAQDHPPHGGYVLAVEAALVARGLQVTVVQVGGVAVWRANLELSAADRTTAVLLRWDELNGWSCQTRGAVPGVAVSFGVSAVPEPAQIADWVTAVLAHPEISPQRTGGPFVTPDLTSRIELYRPNSTA